ncbi:MAG TPA: hypothetical protein VK419_03950 [Bryobacteraceae bacterium]|nr:hypothetical protein [Bryobacteraceae bacterium]
MPEFGYLHDDGVFFVSAKSLAAGSYSIPSLPENPAQTKFPPLYPLYLSLIWRINPNFPANLSLATAMNWMVLAILLVLAFLLLRRYGFSERNALWMTAAIGWNPYVILFGTRMFSEVFFTCWILAVFLILARAGLPRERLSMAILAGIFAGAAYLSRTAGIALLVSVPAYLIWKKELSRAVAFAASMLPFIAGWMLWTRMHAVATRDPTLIYYTDYIRYQFLNVGFDNLAVVLWKNLDQVLYGMGSLVLPKLVDSLPVKILTQVIAVAMISGVVRLARRKIAVDYALFALVSTGILLLWHFPPNERFVLPLYPLLLAGLVTELAHMVKMLGASFHHKDASQRIVAALFASAVAAGFGIALVLQFYTTFSYLKESSDQKTSKLRDLETAYSWIAANLPSSATVFSYDDPLLYLYTGRRGNYLPLLPRWWYAEDHQSIINAYRNVVPYCRSRGLQYLYFTSEDLEREAGPDDREAIGRSIEANPELTPVFRAGIGTLYRVDYQK